MKMIMAVVPREEAECVLQGLINAGYAATFTESRGGMLRQAQHMIFIAVKAQDVEDVLGVIRSQCHSLAQIASNGPGALRSPTSPHQATSAELGGAVVFVWDLERFETY
jgi:uncharacterized protein YaaQ